MEDKRTLRLKFLEDAERRAFLKGVLAAGGGLTLGALLARIPLVRAADPTVGSTTLDYLSLVPRASRPSAAPTGAFWEDLSHRSRIWDGSIDQIVVSTPSAPVRGDVIYGKGVSPVWDRLPLGLNGQVLQSNGVDLLWGTPPAGLAGYYGVRAADYVTLGDGSSGNPYNSTAIQSAINALPARGGVVFVKNGIWGRTGEARITTNLSGSQSEAHIAIRGEGVDLSEFEASSGDSLSGGTQVRVGFDCYTPTDFFDIEIAPRTTSAGVKEILDPTTMNTQPGGVIGRWLGGFTIERCKFRNCDPGIWLTCQNMGLGPFPPNYMQVWNLKIDHCAIVESLRGIQIDTGNSTVNTGIRGRIEHILFHSLTSGRGFSLSSSVGISVSMVIGQFLMEGVGSGTDDFAFYFKASPDPMAVIYGIDFGDGSNAQGDCYINCSPGGGYIYDVLFQKNSTIAGAGYFKIGRINDVGGTPTLTVSPDPSGYSGITLEQPPGRTHSFTTTITGNPERVRRISAPGRSKGYIGTATPTSSPFTYQNLDSYDEMVYLVGGTFSDVSRGGQSLGTLATHLLAPGDSIVITYSAAPSIRRYGVS